MAIQYLESKIEEISESIRICKKKVTKRKSKFSQILG